LILIDSVSLTQEFAQDSFVTGEARAAGGFSKTHEQEMKPALCSLFGEAHKAGTSSI
jgi:hypothetical protein